MLEAYIDGACEPVNPGGTASYGLVIKNNGSIILRETKVVGSNEKMSSNVAEYCGLIAFLKWYKTFGNEQEVIVYSDSQLLVNQMLDIWAVHKGHYLPYYEEAAELLSALPKNFNFKWIPREENRETDALAIGVLRSQGVNIRER